jgi:hypothetical protein
MNIKKVILPCLFLPLPLLLHPQSLTDTSGFVLNSTYHSIKGFIRAGLYGDLNNPSGKPFISSGYSDFGLQAESGLRGKYRAFADIRFRYGSEFHKPVNIINIREAYGEFSTGKVNFTVGQKILKWGRTDFTNPLSKLNPQNYLSRSPDREDMDMGNIIASATWFPSNVMDMQIVAAPFYRSSVLLIDPIPLPENVTVDHMKNIVTDRSLVSYGLKMDFHLHRADLGVVWFDGYDPMPGAALTEFSLDLSGPVPVSSTTITMTPYKTRMAGFDFESSIGDVGVRAEAAWLSPVLSSRTNEYVPLPEIDWVAGIDFGSGDLRITGEYSGKFIRNYYNLEAEPLIGTEPDYAKLAEMLTIPGFDINEYIRQQVEAFNRLYNYQTKRFYHSAGVNIEWDFFYGRMTTSFFTLYNFTSRDWLLIPELKLKPFDGLTVTAGSEIYSGKKASLFDIIKDYMTSIYFGIRADF